MGVVVKIVITRSLQIESIRKLRGWGCESPHVHMKRTPGDDFLSAIALMLMLGVSPITILALMDELNGHRV